MYGALAQGPQLLETNRRVLGCLVRNLNEIGAGDGGVGGKVGEGGWEEKMMFEWLRGFYTTASAEALYGVENPVKWDNRFIQWVW